MDPDFSQIVKDNSQQLSFSPSLKYPSLNQHPIYVSLNNNNITSVSSFPYSNRLFALLCFMEKLFKNLFLSTVSKLPTISTNFHILKSSLFISHLSATCYTLDHFFFSFEWVLSWYPTNHIFWAVWNTFFLVSGHKRLLKRYIFPGPIFNYQSTISNFYFDIKVDNLNNLLGTLHCWYV